MPPPSPPHVTPIPIDSIIVQDVPDTSGQNVNPLIVEDLKKILHQTSLQAQLCTNLVLVSVEELQKVVVEITKEKVNPQEPPSHPPTATSGQSKEKLVQDTIAKIDSKMPDTSTAEEKEKEKIGQWDTSLTTTQV